MNAVVRRRVVLSLIPLFTVVVVIYLIPIANTVYGAFFGHFGRNAGRFVGLGNFITIKTAIVPVIWRTLIWTFGSVIPAVVLGLFLALMFQAEFRLKKLFLSLNLLPYSIPLIIVAACWMFVYNPDFGIINVALLKARLVREPLQFLTYKNALGSVILVRIWRAMPFAFINYYAAMSTIPLEQYEAAEVDGASASQKFLYVTLPNLRSITSTTFIILTVWTFLVFDIIFGMTGGGPIDATATISIQIYQELTRMQDIGTASAWSLIGMCVLTMITIAYWRLFPIGDSREAG